MFCNCFTKWCCKNKMNDKESVNKKIEKSNKEINKTAVYFQKLLNLSNEKCLLCNNKLKQSYYNVFFKCDCCKKQWSTCLDCPLLSENIKHRIGETLQHESGTNLLICYTCLYAQK